MRGRIIRLTAPGKVTFETEPLAPLRAGEIMCETIVTAISPGTEVAAWTGKAPLRSGKAYPRLQGYCNVARVVEAHETEIGVGERVLSFTSHRDRFVLPVDEVLYRLPIGADADSIVCTYLYHLGYNAILRSGVRPGSRVLVIGLGALGLTSCAMAAIAGAEVCAISEHDKPASLAKAMGAAIVLTRGEAERLNSVFGNGADVVITTSDSWADWQIALERAGQNAVIAALGFPGRSEVPGGYNPLASEWFYMKQLRIEAVGWSPEKPDSRQFLRFNERANIDWLARMISARRIDPNLLVSGRFPGEDIASAYEALVSRKGSPVTFLLDWNR